MKKVLLNLINIDINIFKPSLLKLIRHLHFILLVLFISCENFELPSWTAPYTITLLDADYPFNQIIDSEGIVECDDDLVCLEYEDQMFDELGIPSEYFLTSEFTLAPISFSLADLVDEIEIPSIVLDETIPVPNNIPLNIGIECFDVDDFHQNISGQTSIPVPLEVLDVLFSDYEYITITEGNITLNLDHTNFLYPVKIEYTMSSEANGVSNQIFSNQNTSIDIEKNIGENISFHYTISPDYEQTFSCNTCIDMTVFPPNSYECNGFEVDPNMEYSIDINGEVNIDNIYSITGTTKPFSENREESFPLVNNIFSILAGDISSDTQNELGESLNQLELQITNNSQIPLTISLDLLNFMNQQGETLELIEFVVNENGGTEQQITPFNEASIQHYPVIPPEEPQEAITDIYMGIAMNYPSKEGTFILENLYSFDIKEVAIKPIKFDRITTVVHDFIIDVPSLTLSSVPYGIEGLEFVDPILIINLDNQIKIDNTLTFNLESLLEGEVVSTLALEIVLNIPDDFNTSANTMITIQGDSYTVSDGQTENVYTLENGSNGPITLTEFLENTSDELRVSGEASLNGIGYLEPGDQASISGNFGLKVPFTIIIGDWIEPDTYTDINLLPSNPTYLSPINSSTKQSINNSLYAVSMSSDIENSSIFVGSVSMIVSTDENYVPLNFDDLGNLSEISNCIDFPCMIDKNSDVFSNLLESLKVLNEDTGELEFIETNIGLLNEDNILLIEYTPMSDIDSKPKLIKFITDTDFLLIGRFATLDLPSPVIDENGNVQTPGSISYKEPIIIDEDQIDLIVYTSEQKDRYMSPLIKLLNSNYVNENNVPQNDGGIVNVLITNNIKIDSYITFVISPGDY